MSLDSRDGMDRVTRIPPTEPGRRIEDGRIPVDGQTDDSNRKEDVGRGREDTPCFDGSPTSDSKSRGKSLSPVKRKDRNNCRTTSGKFLGHRVQVDPYPLLWLVPLFSIETGTSRLQRMSVWDENGPSCLTPKNVSCLDTAHGFKVLRP